MTCTTCSAKLPKGTAYCGSCGTRTPMEKRRESLTGMLFDHRYRIESKLAAGGFGAIYRATNVLTGRRRRSRCCTRSRERPARSARGSAREAGGAGEPPRSRTPSRRYEHGETPDGTLFIVMELLDGQEPAGRAARARARCRGGGTLLGSCAAWQLAHRGARARPRAPRSEAGEHLPRAPRRRGRLRERCSTSASRRCSARQRPRRTSWT